MARRRKQHQAWAKKNHCPKKVQWYNKNRYAGYGRLIRRLTAGMSDYDLWHFAICKGRFCWNNIKKTLSEVK